MPSVPPFSRQEKLSDYAPNLKPVAWREEMIQSLDGTRITLCIGTLGFDLPDPERHAGSTHTFIIYFQGNASSLPPRLPLLSEALKMVCLTEPQTACTIVALSYRGFWTSSGRASQPGIEKDAAAAIDWTQKLRASAKGKTQLVLWGQSIGAGVATQATANFLRDSASAHQQSEQQPIDGLVLETPFVSVRAMLTSLYPQKWLPYRYLWPFLRNWWDSAAALRDIRRLNGPRDVLVITASKDEVVPSEHGLQLVQLASHLGFKTRHVEVSGALHHEAVGRREGRAALRKFLRQLEGDSEC